MNDSARILFALIVAIFVAKTTAHGAWDDVFKEPSTKSTTKESRKAKTFSDDIHSTTETINTGIPIAPEFTGIFDKIQQIYAVIPDNTPLKAMLLSKFSQIYLLSGDYLKAEQMCVSGVKMAEKTTDANSRENLTCIMQLALFYEAIGDNARTVDLINKCLNICANNQSLATGYSHTLYSILALNQIQCGLLNEADSSSQKSVEEGIKHSKSEGSQILIKPLYSRAMSLMAYGEYESAEKILKQAYEIVFPLYKTKPKTGENVWLLTAYPSILMAQSDAYISQGNIAVANIVEKSMESYREDQKASLEKFTSLKQDAGRANILLESDFQANKSVLAFLSGNMTFAEKAARAHLALIVQNMDSALQLVESQRLGWQIKNLSFTMPVAFCSPIELADYILQWKGIVLESIINDRKTFLANQSNSSRNTLDQLIRLRRQLAQIQVMPSQKSQSSAKLIAALKAQVFSLEQLIANKSTSYTITEKVKKAKLESIKSVLYEQSALVEYITYRKLPDRRYGEKLFGALLITKNADPVWFPLGSLSAVETLSKTLHSQIDSDTSTDKEIASTLQSLNNALWSKITDVLPRNVKEIYISPDGPMNFIPFSCLLQPDGDFLSQKYCLSYVSSGRDLLIQSQPISTGNISIVANPEFDSDSVGGSVNTKLALRSLELNEFSTISLPPLPGTEAEAKQLVDIASVSGWKSNLLEGSDATEKNLASIKSPTVLHLATHGFFLGKTVDRTLSESTRGMALTSNDAAKIQSGEAFYLNPMQQSGLALAGAQRTLKLWQRGEAPDPANDGILTAEEVVGLDLSGTWLGTLSACETGTGESQSGEGVFGLRRAFMVAGARNLLMTLWSVSDETTAKVMGDFYTEAFATGDAPRSLAKIQRAWLVKLRNEKGLLAAVRDAGPFVMATTGMLIANPTLSVDKQSKFSR